MGDASVGRAGLWVWAVLAAAPLVLHARSGAATTPIAAPIVKPPGTVTQWQPNLSKWTTTYLAPNTPANGGAIPPAFVNGTFFAPGPIMGAGVAINETSTDGLHWSTSSKMTWSPQSGFNTSTGFVQSTYGYQNGTYVAGFGDGAIYTSPDAVNWSPVPPANSAPISAVACGAGKCVFGSNGFFETSNAAMNGWTQNLVNTSNGKLAPGGSNQINAMAYGNGRFVAVTSAGGYGCGPSSGMIMSSPDGTNWSLVGKSTGYSGVTFTGSAFLAVGAGGGYATSPDGVTWTTGIVPNAQCSNLVSVACAPTVCVAVGWLGGLFTTPSASISWTSPASIPGPVYGITFGANRFVAYGGGSNGIMVSTSGSTALPI